MPTIVAAIALIAISMLVMAVGVLFKRPPLKGSCGGVAANCLCDRLGKPRACGRKDSAPALHQLEKHK